MTSARTSSVQEEVYGDIIKSYMESSCTGELKLVVVGEAGQGKSTLINGLLGQEVAKEGETFKAGTLDIRHHAINQNGISIKIWDTPGFGIEDEEEDEKMVEQLRSSDCYPHDLALFCFRMDAQRFPTRIHRTTVRKLTEVFGVKFWEHTLFVLTFANNVQHICPPKEEFEEFFSFRAWTLEQEVKKMLQKEVKLPEAISQNIRAIPVGSYKIPGYDKTNPWKLPGCEDWFLWFWMECTEHIRQSALIALLKANKHRIKTVSEEAPPFGQDLPLPKETFERSIKTPLAQYILTASDKSQENPPQNMSLEEGGGSGGGLEEVRNLEVDTCNIVEEEEATAAPLSLQNSTRINIPDSIPEDEVIEATENFPPEPNENFTAPYSREIPLVDILLRQLDNKDSSFYQYVSGFAKKRGSSVWVFGHIGGFIEGFYKWLGKGRRMRNKQQPPV